MDQWAFTFEIVWQTTALDHDPISLTGRGLLRAVVADPLLLRFCTSDATDASPRASSAPAAVVHRAEPRTRHQCGVANCQRRYITIRHRNRIDSSPRTNPRTGGGGVRPK